MKTLNYFIAFYIMLFFLVLSCTEQPTTPVNPENQILEKGPVINKVTGSAQISYEGKVIVNTMNAREYEDGTYGGQYEINMQGVFQLMEHGEVMFLKIYNDVPDYGTVAMVGGQVKNSNVPAQVGIYECYAIVDNGTSADMINWYIPYITTLEHAQEFWNISPIDFINGFVTSWGETWLGAEMTECEIGNIQIH